MAGLGLNFRFRALTKGRLKLTPYPATFLINLYVEAFLRDIQRKVQPYPPIPPPPNRYKRTYNLYKSWQLYDRSSQYQIDKYIQVGNTTAYYAKFVHGVFQRPYHRAHGWVKLSEVVDARRAEYAAGLRTIMGQLRVTGEGA
jgi:hypothetical protein